LVDSAGKNVELSDKARGGLDLWVKKMYQCKDPPVKLIKERGGVERNFQKRGRKGGRDPFVGEILLGWFLKEASCYIHGSERKEEITEKKRGGNPSNLGGRLPRTEIEAAAPGWRREEKRVQEKKFGTGGEKRVKSV